MGSYPRQEDDLATVRDRLASQEQELQRLREERDTIEREIDEMDSRRVWEWERAEAAEAEVQRLREGLREAVDMIRFPCAECKPFIDKARALLAAPAGEREGGEA